MVSMGYRLHLYGQEYSCQDDNDHYEQPQPEPNDQASHLRTLSQFGIDTVLYRSTVVCQYVSLPQQLSTGAQDGSCQCGIQYYCVVRCMETT